MDWLGMLSALHPFVGERVEASVTDRSGDALVVTTNGTLRAAFPVNEHGSRDLVLEIRHDAREVTCLVLHEHLYADAWWDGEETLVVRCGAVDVAVEPERD